MLVVIIALIATLIMGVPIAFSIGISCLAYFTIVSPIPVDVILQRMISGVDSFPLLALPLFLLAGVIMDKGGATKRILQFVEKFVNRIDGGMSVVSVVASMFFGAITGSGVAGTAAIVQMMGKDMNERGYEKKFIAPLIAGSGVLGMVIPPSLSMVIFGVAGSVSVSSLLLGGIIPGILTGLVLIILCIIISKKRGYDPKTDNTIPASVKFKSFCKSFLSLMTPVIILGGIMTGAFTPTESAVAGVVYAFFLGIIVYKEIKIKDLPKILWESALSSATILFIISTANAFAWILAKENVAVTMSNFFLTITSNPTILLLLINVLLIILGTFMEATAITIILAPILVPVVMQYGIDPVHFGVMFILNLAIGGVTPPLGVTLITSTKILDIPMEKTFPDTLYVIGAMIVSLLLVMIIPDLVLLIPNIFG